MTIQVNLICETNYQELTTLTLVLDGVTAPFCLQSTVDGVAVTFSNLKVVILMIEEHICPLNLFLGAN